MIPALRQGECFPKGSLGRLIHRVSPFLMWLNLLALGVLACEVVVAGYEHHLAGPGDIASPPAGMIASAAWALYACIAMLGAGVVAARWLRDPLRRVLSQIAIAVFVSGLLIASVLTLLLPSLRTLGAME